MIDRDHELSVSRQAKALGISRGSLYHLPRLTSDTDLKLMRRIDGLHPEYPFASSRMLKALLQAEHSVTSASPLQSPAAPGCALDNLTPPSGRHSATRASSVDLWAASVAAIGARATRSKSMLVRALIVGPHALQKHSEEAVGFQKGHGRRELVDQQLDPELA